MSTEKNNQKVNGSDLLRWFESGADEVYSHAKYINLINVFPVADGDTGSNLASTLRAMVSVPSPVQGFHSMLKTISQQALEGARGNSGIIFASYINGLALESTRCEAVSIAQFASILHNAVQHLYAAVSDPKEGTLMSVIRDWAQYINGNHSRYRRFADLLTDAYQYALTLLEKTKSQMAVLRKNNVVDAGAAGFIRFLEGINRVAGSAHPVESFAEQPFDLIVDDSTDSAYRYCTEALVNLASPPEENRDALTETIKRALQPMGDSLIVSARSAKLKVHIHTNTPELVMRVLEPYGQFAEQKADDMFLQTMLRAASAGGVGLVTDTIADIPDTYLLAHGISAVSMGVLKNTQAYLDKLTIRLPQLFEAMDAPGAYPSTSQPEPARIRAILSSRLEQFDSLIVLSVADKLSGTHQAFVKAAEELQAQGKRITVIDTHLNSGAEGLLVKLAGDLIAQGASHDEIVTQIKARIPRTKIYVCLNTLKYAVRGGRVPNTVGAIGMKLGMRPIMTLDKEGHGAAFGVAFNQKGLTRKIMRLVQKAMQKGGIEAYSIVHGDNLPLAKDYAEQLTRITGQQPAFISEISSAVAIHSGPGTVAVCLTQKAGDAA